MRLFKELVFQIGLLEHQLFSKNPPKMDFFLCFEKISARNFFRNPQVARLGFTYLFLKLSWLLSTCQLIQSYNSLKFHNRKNLITNDHNYPKSRNNKHVWITSSFTSFLRYCTEIATFLFWVIWACLAVIVSL